MVVIDKEICGIRQLGRESLHEYCERFKKLCASFLIIKYINNSLFSNFIKYSISWTDK